MTLLFSPALSPSVAPDLESHWEEMLFILVAHCSEGMVHRETHTDDRIHRVSPERLNVQSPLALIGRAVAFLLFNWLVCYSEERTNLREGKVWRKEREPSH